ncbi:MAG TPA: 4Fe-4S binding protein [Ignavibacteriaceae bacterium]|nr:4Fe-4S binding protein [Ignavibacteriaceae bacterium]
MSFKLVKFARVLISLLFLIGISALFLDIKGYFYPSVSKSVLFFQFTPSLIDFILTLSFSAVGFLIVLILTFLFGRVYCSFLCPLGTFQDLFIFVKNKINRKKKYSYSKPFNKTRYFFLSFTLLFLLFNSFFFILLLDPYSAFGRIANNLFRPLIIFANNIVSSTLSGFDIYSVYPYDYKGFNPLTFGLALLTLLIVGFMSFKWGRLWCNSVCPVGTLLGLLSKFSLFRYSIRTEDCKNCGLCEWSCKANCIDSKDMTIDMSRCVGCFNCMTVCSSGGVVLRSYFGKEIRGYKPRKINASKRKFLSELFAFSASAVSLGFFQKIPLITKDSTIPENRKVPVAPPGALSINRFNMSCTGCNLCVAACPTQVLQPAFLEYGIMNMFQPRMDYIRSFCNFDCTICTDICPTGALQPLSLEKKKLLQLGVAKLIKDNCIVFTQETECGACSEHCPTKAVNMVPYKKIAAPEIKEEYCIGCGACEKACPTKPFKAIYVLGNYTHKTAVKNLSKPKQPVMKETDDFPF